MKYSEDIKKRLGKRIKELRIKKNLTQEKLAEMIGIGERNLSKIECGNNFLTAETLSKLLLALNVEAADLFSFEDKKDFDCIKTELIEAITNETVDIPLLYRLYKSIK